MMRVADLVEAGELKSSPQYSSFEITRPTFEHDKPASGRQRGKRQCYGISACIVIFAMAAIVSVSVVTWKKHEHDDSNIGHTRDGAQSFARAPGPREHTIFGDDRSWANSPPAHMTAPEPVESPLPISFSLTGPAPISTTSDNVLPSLDLAPYGKICNETIDRAVCLDMFRSYTSPHKVINLQQSTVMVVEAAEHVLNQSYILAQGMKEKDKENAALQQCIDVFAEALNDVKTSISLVASMDVHNQGSIRPCVQIFLSAAMTNQDTCQEGIDEVGSFPGSDQITGKQAKKVNTMLSIALTFVDHFIIPTMEPDHHRRHLHTESRGTKRIRRGLLSLKY